MLPFDQIRQRKLFQWAVAYLAGAWLTLQVLGLLSQPFAWPDLVVRAATVVLGVGFFGILVLGWYHGEQGRQKASGVELLMLAGILLIAGVAVSLVSRGGRSVEAIEARAAGSESAVALASVPEQGSIAVLPFVNMSSDPEQEYFSDGLTEELLNVLAQIPELRVAARTSSFSFKGTSVPVDSVGRALNVANVLEGSVRKSGDQVRITAQLVDARTGFHLWSETYDRSIQDVFAVQDEISKAIVAELQLELAGGAPLVKQATSSPEAHALVLRSFAAQRVGTRESIAEAVDYARRAIQLDGEYAQAHSRLATALSTQAYFRFIPQDQGYAEARASGTRALELDPDLATAHTVIGRIADLADWDFVAAEKHYRLALENNPGDSQTHSVLGWLVMRLGRPDESIREALLAIKLDPLSAGAYNNLGALYTYAGQHGRGAEAFEASLALAPNSPVPMTNLALTYSETGRHEEALRLANGALAMDPESQFSSATMAYVLAGAGRISESKEQLRTLEATNEASPYLIAGVHTALGDRDRAFELLDQAVDEHDDLVPDLGVDPVFLSLRGDPRFTRLLERIGLPTWERRST